MSDSVDFRHLEYLVAIHEGKNFTKAAERVFRSQPAVSQQIRALEDDVGFPIFVRGGRDGVSPTPAGELVLNWARNVLAERREIFIMALAIHNGDVPPLKLGFSPFVNPTLLQTFRTAYGALFPGCEIQLLSGDTTHSLQRLNQGGLDCAVLPMPIDRDWWNVLQVAQSPLVLCMRRDDPLASQTQIDIRQVGARITIFRDPELHPPAHSRLAEMFTEVGISLELVNSAATPSDMQWMVKETGGMALIDQLAPLDFGVVTRPIAGLNWTVDTAFVTTKAAAHIALPFVEKYLRDNGLSGERKESRPENIRPQQLKLIS
jgi:LysR family transcriptional regulator, hydrogen peroxide-inducible genes activator